MAAESGLSPVQFGFKPHRESIGMDVDKRMDRSKFQTKRIKLDSTFRASQTKMDPHTVDGYASNPPKGNRDRWGGRPEVIKRGDEHVVWNGHHRIAGAKRGGRKTMTVDYQELD